MPRADHLPSFKVDTTMTKCPSNPLGIKGCGEAGAIAAPAAVINAITDAIGTEDDRHAGDAAGGVGGVTEIRPGNAARGLTQRDYGELTMYGFTFERPETLRQAVNLLSKNAEAKLLAGGHTLLPTMKLRLAGPPMLIDLSRIEGLAGIEPSGRALTIGAMTRHVDVHTSPVVQQSLPVLAKLAGMIGDPAVRHMGTIGGSVANNDPTADYPAACLGLGATIITNKRRIKADEFFTGMFSTALEPSEIITKMSFPIPKKAAYQKFRNQASRYALVGVFVAKRGSEIRVAVTGAGSNGVFRVAAFEEALKKRFSPKSLEGLTVPADRPQQRHPRQRRIPRASGRRLARRAVAEAVGK